MKSNSIVRLMFAIAFLIVGIQGFILRDLTFTITLLLLIPIPFLQNMAFTWTSRSRQSGDPDHHRKAAWASNGVWAIAQAFIAANIYTPIAIMIQSSTLSGVEIAKILLTILVYSIATAEGSVFMMKINLGRVTKLPKMFSFLVEKGNREVGKR
ncbi:hypothetical protein LCGC14_2118190 [marine sediment metagenome]|uniref:Uncharacterized protein n=1 Tax=marine sediment metagenome TaxID=412755 RepID=A0A0F9E521_9ZZZZ